MKRVNTILLASIIFLHAHLVAHAATEASISINPSTASITQPTRIAVLINGVEQEFNAVQADIAFSAGININNIVPGDCNFSFIKSPTVSDLAFSGVILGKSAKKCTAFTIDAISDKKDVAATISKSQLFRYGDAKQIPHRVINGRYNSSSSPLVPIAISIMVIVTECWIYSREIGKKTT